MRRIIYLLAGLVLMGGLGGMWVAQPPDPEVRGARMSEWVWRLTGRWTSWHGNYGHPPEVAAVFRENREEAIVHLIQVLHNRPHRTDALRRKLSKHLPKPLGEKIEPRRPSLRWAAVMALSALAQRTPDPRIANTFVWAMSDPDPLVRKVAAYEMGSWIDPADHERLARCLEIALNDESGSVRRDACRRIFLSAQTNPEYARALVRLREKVRQMASGDPDGQACHAAQRALGELEKLEAPSGNAAQ